MQQTQRAKYGKCYIGGMGAAWVAGLLIAGSDGPCMPWLNGMGLLLFFGASFLLSRYFKPSHSNIDSVIPTRAYQKPGAIVRESKKKNQRIKIRYALSI